MILTFENAFGEMPKINFRMGKLPNTYTKEKDSGLSIPFLAGAATSWRFRNQSFNMPLLM